MVFRDYADLRQMPDPGQDFGHESLVPDWQMLGNDMAGDCYVAGVTHGFMLWHAETGVPVSFSTQSAIQYYQELTEEFNGQPFDPSLADPITGENPTDTGIAVAQALPLLRTVGIPDDSGNSHKIGAFLKLRPGNVNELRYAAKYFDGVLLGVRFPTQWMDIFSGGGRVWPALPRPNYDGGHCISCVAFRGGYPKVITWGQPVELTAAAYEETCDEAYAVLSEEKLINGFDLDGLSMAKLQDDFRQLTRVR